ncbi:MAG TPA: sugar ABC transporter substrate-binding protein [Devosiaceae bacterium]
MHKFLQIAALTAGLALSAAPALAQTTLTFPSWQTEDKVFQPWWQAVIAEFEAKHPDVKIEMSNIPFNQYVDQLTVQFAGGNPPDIVHLPARNFGQFAENGWLAPLDDMLAQTDIPKTWNPMQQGMVWNGQTEGVLLMGYGYVLFYNQALLDKAGITAVPKTVDELIADAQKITNKDAGIFGFGGVTTEHPNVSAELSNWILSQGADPLKDGKYNFTDPAVIAAVDKYREAYKQAAPGLNSTQLNQIFIDGKVGFMIAGPFAWPAFKGADGKQMADARMALLPFPKTAGGMSNSLHLSATTDPEKQKLAWEFIRTAAEPKFQEMYTEMTYSPASRQGALTPETIASNPVLKTVNDAAVGAIDVFPTIPAVRAAYNDYSTALTQAGIRLQTTSDPTATVMGDLQNELQQRIPLN